ncbi:hypothetical protein [Deinococcus pimensis]|uniref:hypothetical protein n=1 Tax=Deinococcus pimensis TaxID=309888 RepID=UPI000485600F|nr:hypothetical protein [Deinococcus pimensis]
MTQGQKLSTQHTQIVLDGLRSGMTDAEVVRASGVSLSTVKRLKKTHGLHTNLTLDKAREPGIEYVTNRARQYGMTVQPAPAGARYDLLIKDQRVVVRTLTPNADGEFRYRLPNAARNMDGMPYFAGGAFDADVVALACLPEQGRTPQAYLFDSASFPTSVKFGEHDVYYAHRERWGIFLPAAIQRSA